MKLLGLVLIVFTFSQCGSMKLEKNPPFKITSAMYQNWVGGMPGSSGTILTISYKSETSITFDSIYFSNRNAKIEGNPIKGKKTITANIINSVSSGKKDLILHSDSTKELKNEMPELTDFPFELKENEAVISYKVGDKTKYFKIEGMKNGGDIIHQ